MVFEYVWSRGGSSYLKDHSASTSTEENLQDIEFFSNLGIIIYHFTSHSYGIFQIEEKKNFWGCPNILLSFPSLQLDLKINVYVDLHIEASPQF